jgi:hypothetical protein
MADIEAQKEAWILEAVQRMQQLNLQPGAGGNQNAAAAESQRLADVKQLTPTATARAAVPAYILAGLPADVKQLLQGTAPVPLLPMHHLMVSQTLHSMLLGGQGSGSMKYEAQCSLTYEGILDLESSWLAGYERLIDSVLVGDADSKALLKAPLDGLRYLHGWLTAAVRGRLTTIESYVSQGSDSMFWREYGQHSC